MSVDVDCVVIGAGVVGLAIARALAQSGREVLVAEATEAIGTGTSSRNSEVIHAGIYYPAGSLKARLCVEGRDRLYQFCPRHGIPHARCGKFIVAADETEARELTVLKGKADANGVRVELADLDFLKKKELEIQPKTSRYKASQTATVRAVGEMVAVLAQFNHR